MTNQCKKGPLPLGVAGHGGVEREWPWGIASGQSASLKGFLYNTKPTNHQCNEIIRDGSQPSRATLRPAPQVRNCRRKAHMKYLGMILAEFTDADKISISYFDF